MGTTLKKLTSDLKDLQIEGIDGANLILKGVELLVEHADSPWAELIKGIFPPAPFVIGFLKAITLKKPNFDLDTCAALAIQQAYLESFQNNLEKEKGKLEARFDLDNVNFDKKKIKKDLTLSVEELKNLKIEAEQLDFPNLHNEKLVKDHLEPLVAKWLTKRFFREEENKHEAMNFARRISYQLYPKILRIVAENEELFAPLSHYLKQVDHGELREQRGIKKYKADLMMLPSRPVFNETFALKDLYVELDATDTDGNTAPLMQTVLAQLHEEEHVIFIQAGPGKGKSVFCQMLAARVATEKPDWIPILIQLRDEHFIVEDHFQDSVRKYVEEHFSLTDDLLRSRSFLFILDGFDELWLSAERDHSLKFFFHRLSNFQQRSRGSDKWNHKIVVTGRPMRIKDIEAELPDNFLRLEIKNMNDCQIKQWLENWKELFGYRVVRDLRRFLDECHVFRSPAENEEHDIRSLTREPLLLYMLGAMHRDGVLDTEMLSTSKRINIYDRAVSWVCGEEKYATLYRKSNRVLEASEITPYELRQLLQETALCIWQGGRGYAPIERIKKRLSDRAPEKTKKLFDSGLEGVHNLLASFYFRRLKGHSGNVEFSHKSFGEYLVAEQMVETLIEIGEQYKSEHSRQKENVLKDIKDVANRFYSVFGAALLTSEIRDFVMDVVSEKLNSEKLNKDDIKHVTERLYHLYIDYSDGRWMDEKITETRWNEIKRYDVVISLLKFEAQIGINLFLLLCLLFNKVGDTFYVCGKDRDDFDPNRFRRLYGFGEFAESYGFFRPIYYYDLLKNVNLSGANLGGMYLPFTDLSAVDLQGAILLDTNLQEADLQGANLQGAILERTNLEEANLQGANLEGGNLRKARLQKADLQNTDLSFANLGETDLSEADLRHARLKGTEFCDANVSDTKILEAQLEEYQRLFTEKQLSQMNRVND